MAVKDRYIEITGARENNLKDIDVQIPKDALTVITGVSGSGKSSLAFDTLYAEGQRRYLDTFSSYARQMIGHLEKPDVEHIQGLSPVISIEQKTTGWNPRSTVGTVTELYDYLRLLYARVGIAYSYQTGHKMVQYTSAQIMDYIMETFTDEKIAILGPLVRGRKGHYRELFDQYRKMGYTKMRVDGELIPLEPNMRVDRYKTHDIEVVIDRLKTTTAKQHRITQAVDTALDIGKGLVFIEALDQGGKIYTFSKQLMDPESGLSYEVPSPNTFSFNSPYGYCPECRGLGNLIRADIHKIIPDPESTIGKGGLAPLGEEKDNYNFKQLRILAKKHKFNFATPIKDIPPTAYDIILRGSLQHEYEDALGEGSGESFYTVTKYGLIGMVERMYHQGMGERSRNWAEQYLHHATCPTCEGTRLKKEATYFRIWDKHIAELAQMSLNDFFDWILQLPNHMDKRQKIIGSELVREITARTRFLLDVGLGYLQLDRPARSLSGGESQRTRLATQIGSKLTGITYILDEPSIGLHARDNERLISALRDLTSIGNTVVVVEHDKEIMLASDYLIDIGPGAGKHGGYIVAQGRTKKLRAKASETIRYLKGKEQISVPESRRSGSGHHIVLYGAKGHNLQNVTLDIPLGTFVCITGVSGSGKSTLIHETLYPILRNHINGTLKTALPYKKIKGLDHIDKIIEIDQKPIGRTPRSNPATYTKVFGDIRSLYAKTPEAKIRGYKPGRFSFNVKGGRCESCKGGGRQVIEMNFLPDVMIECEQCQGRRYNRETLEVLYKGKHISDVLDMTVAEAAIFFEPMPKIARKLNTLVAVGLGYITLGQSATTLSGGEAQRVKLAEELAKRDTGSTFYILDEPTTGLHFQDIEYLLKVIQMLVDRGNTVLIIEHNMDIIKCADHIVDIGPEGGIYGGRIVAEGTPEDVAEIAESLTGQYLRHELS